MHLIGGPNIRRTGEGTVEHSIKEKIAKYIIAPEEKHYSPRNKRIA
jgi:hypothetical protein